MVRHKSRWLLIRIDREERVKSIKDTQKDPPDTPSAPIEKKNIYHALRIMIEGAFGIARAGIVEDIQVRLYNSETSLAVVKVPREDCDLIRSAITLLTQIQDEPITAVVLSTSGSARTAKIAAMRQVKKAFKMKYSDVNNTNVGKKELQKLEVLIDQVRGMD